MEIPSWIKESIPRRKSSEFLKNRFHSRKLHTVCEEAGCPNIGDCFSRGTATFLIMGDICTRNCGFCGIKAGKPDALDYDEPGRVAFEVKYLNLKHVVITSPTRDDLKDGGSSFFTETIRIIKEVNSDISVEVLIPDFKGNEKAIIDIINSGIDVLNHNVETVPRLYNTVRPKAEYIRSLNIFKKASLYSTVLPLKSGLMLGLGESKEEVINVFHDLIKVGCNILTIGQYLQPSKKHLPVFRYVHPEEFEEYRRVGEEMGFDYITSAPLVRSSYNAAKALSIYRKRNS